MSYVPARRRVGFGDGTAAGAAVGTAVAGPVGTAVGGFVGSLFKTGSPRYEGGPLLSSVQNRLAALKAGDQTAINQTHQDSVTGGPGWKDVAVVLAPVVRPDIFAPAIRSLTTQEQALVAPYVVAGAPILTVAPTGKNPTGPLVTQVVQAGLTGPLGIILGLGLLGAFIFKPKRRRR